MKKLFYLIVLYFIFSISQALAIADVAQNFKSYLQEIKSVAVDFTQKDSSENITQGKLLINKPFRFRCNYYPPFPLVIIGNKNFVSIYDYDMQHVSRIKSSENIFNFLLEDKQDFEKNFNIKSALEDGNLFSITLYHKSSGRTSEVIFDKSTKQIKEMKIFEDDNIITISFNKIVKVENFDADLFQLKNPEIFGAPSRLDKDAIEKKYIVSNK